METLKAAAFKLHFTMKQVVHDLSHLSIAFVHTSNYIGMNASDTEHQDFLPSRDMCSSPTSINLASPIATPSKTTASPFVAKALSSPCWLSGRLISHRVVVALRFLFLHLLLTHNNTTSLTPHHHNASTLGFIITPISHITPMP
jgi:hypothetical protein